MFNSSYVFKQFMIIIIPSSLNKLEYFSIRINKDMFSFNSNNFSDDEIHFPKYSAP